GCGHGGGDSGCLADVESLSSASGQAEGKGKGDAADCFHESSSHIEVAQTGRVPARIIYTGRRQFTPSPGAMSRHAQCLGSSCLYCALLDVREVAMPMIAGSEPQSCFYHSRGLRLHYLDWGNHDAPILLLIHGGLEHARAWDHLARQLRNDWHVV